MFLFESEGKILPSGIVQQAIHDPATTNQSAAGEENKREKEGEEGAKREGEVRECTRARARNSERERGGRWIVICVRSQIATTVEAQR